ncbi:hypothetical protein EU538_04055 [Candidatus Thorarchaeota archaeon]|nr:MAG: hypothetical protein EU538_04055 [Candidatus Thorarchaeota archaeon]
MADSRQILKGALVHLALFVVNFCVLVGVVDSFQIFQEDLPLLNTLILGYMLTHTFLLLSVQLGVQILELIRIRLPTFLPSYYFQFADDETIPMPLLDPTKSRLAFIVLLLVISGGPVFYPIFAVYGLLLVYAHVVIIALDPSTILGYFEIFLNWMPPILLIIVLVVILSIVIIEFKHV